MLRIPKSEQLGSVDTEFTLAESFSYWLLNEAFEHFFGRWPFEISALLA